MYFSFDFLTRPTHLRLSYQNQLQTARTRRSLVVSQLRVLVFSVTTVDVFSMSTLAITTMTVEMPQMNRFRLVRPETLLVARINFSVCRTKSVLEKTERVIPTTRLIIASIAWMDQTRMPKCVLKWSAQTQIDHSSVRGLQKHRGAFPTIG